MYRILAALIAAALLLGVAWLFGERRAVAPTPPPTLTAQSATTTVAKDDETVTTKPIPLPSPVGTTGAVTGIVTLGPTCPIEQNPPEERCAPKPYETVIVITSTEGTHTSTRTDASGKFSITLASGTYTFAPQGGQLLPRCAPQEVRVNASSHQYVQLSCDSGIR